MKAEEKPVVHRADGLGVTRCGVQVWPKGRRRAERTADQLVKVSQGNKETTCEACLAEMAPVAREVAFWSTTDDAEQLYHSEIEEALDAWADDHFPDPLPEKITVYGWARMELPTARRIGEVALEAVLEYLDEEHGDPNDATEQSDEMLTLAALFGKGIRDHYTCWSCEVISTREVAVSEYVDVAAYEKNAASERAKVSA